MKRFLFGIFFTLVANSASAVVITESDTGIVFSGADCKMLGYEVLDWKFKADFFDYLQAEVDFSLDCVRRNGRTYTMRRRGVVMFGTLEFDWLTREWNHGRTRVALMHEWYDIEFINDVFPNIWANMEDHSVSFRVQLERINPE